MSNEINKEKDSSNNSINYIDPIIDLTQNKPSIFKRRVSFDNYQPDIMNSLISSTKNLSLYSTSLPTNNTQLYSERQKLDDSTHPNSHQFNKPTSILKRSKIDKEKDDLNYVDDQNFNFASYNKQPISSSKNLTINKSLLNNNNNNNNNSNNNSNNNNGIINNFALSPTNSINNIRKKSYSEMSDNELLALDSQFNIRSVDIQKSYGFSFRSRLSPPTITNCDKDPLEYSLNSNFKNLSPNEYPTKPIITKNSICFNYENSNLKKSDLNDKFYLIILSNKSSSLSSLDYYINNILNKGDTVVICCSLSTSILGNERNDQLNEFINSFTNLILNYFEKNLKLSSSFLINITFEFFKSFSYFNEVLNLYQPNMIIIGTNNIKTKSTSITNLNKKLISVVHVGLDQNLNSINDLINNKDDNFLKSSNQSVTFQIPQFDREKRKKSTNKIAISRISSTTSISSNGSLSSDSDDRLTKIKTNDTTVSSLFDNLNDTPILETSKFVNNNYNLNTTRRRSMLDVLNSDNLNSCSKTTTSNYDESAIDESDDFYDPNKLYIPHGGNIRRKSSTSNESPRRLSAHEQEKKELFEKYQRRLSAVKVGPQNNDDKIKQKSKSLLTSNDDNMEDSNNKNLNSENSENKGLFKRWLKSASSYI